MGRLRRKLVTIIVAAALLPLCALGLNSVGGDAKAEDTTPPPESVTHAECFGGDKAHDGAIEITASSSELTNGNAYYLSDDAQLTGTLSVAKNANVSICLNGHVLRAAANSRAIEMLSGATLSIYDCSSEECDHYYSKGDDGVYQFDDALTAETAY